MTKFIGLALLVCASVLTSCAMGNKYDYRAAAPKLPLTGSGAIGFAALDHRAYVVDGSRKANFVGIQRGGFGNPFDVTTASGRPLVEDLGEAVEKSLTASGFTVTRLDTDGADVHALADMARAKQLKRVILLDVKDWKSDSMMKVTLHYDLTLLVYDDAGNVVAQSKLAAVEPVSGPGMAAQNSRAMAATFERKIGFLFTPPEVRAALTF